MNITHWGYTFSELNGVLKRTNLPISYLTSMSNGISLELGCDEETAKLFLQEVKEYYENAKQPTKDAIYQVPN